MVSDLIRVIIVKTGPETCQEVILRKHVEKIDGTNGDIHIWKLRRTYFSRCDVGQLKWLGVHLLNTSGVRGSKWDLNTLAGLQKRFFKNSCSLNMMKPDQRDVRCSLPRASRKHSRSAMLHFQGKHCIEVLQFWSCRYQCAVACNSCLWSLGLLPSMTTVYKETQDCRYRYQAYAPIRCWSDLEQATCCIPRQSMSKRLSSMSPTRMPGDMLITPLVRVIIPVTYL